MQQQSLCDFSMRDLESGSQKILRQGLESHHPHQAMGVMTRAGGGEGGRRRRKKWKREGREDGELRGRKESLRFCM
jgi:hypothetical protein